MAAPVYSTDLTTITLAQTITGWSALGGGQSGLNDETDYFINGSQCVSKNGFTGSTRGHIFNSGSVTIPSTSAIFFWVKQNNRNLMDTTSNGGTQVLVGSSTTDFNRFYVDGNDSEGSRFAGWRNYAVDPNQTPSATTGSPSNTSNFGVQWAILGSGSLKGAPNGTNAIRYGRELICTEGDQTSGFSNFDDAANFDSDTSRAWGLLTPVTGAYQFHGLFSFGSSTTPVDFRDSNRNIVVLDDPFLPPDFNTFEVRNVSSNVELSSVSVSALGSTSRGRWITTGNANVLKVGCTFTAMDSFSYKSNTTITDNVYRSCGQISQFGATINGGLVEDSTSPVAIVIDDASVVSGMTFSNNDTAIDLTGAIVSDTVDLNNLTFTSNTTDIVVNSPNDITINNLSGSNASTCVNTGGGSCVIVNAVPVVVTVVDENLLPIPGVRVRAVRSDTKSPIIDNQVTGVDGKTSASFSGTTPQSVEGWTRSYDLIGSDLQPGQVTGTIEPNFGFSQTIQMKAE